MSGDLWLRLSRPEGYEDVHPELVLEDAGVRPEFQPEIVTDEITRLRALLADLRPILARAEPVYVPPKGDCIWGAPEREALLARIDAALGGEA